MALNAAEISDLVFRRVPRSGHTEFSLTSQMIDVLAVLDGRRNLSEVVRQTGHDFGVVKAVVSQLLKLKLIEVVQLAPPVVDDEFMSYLQRELSLAIGPLAEVVIEDAVYDLGYPEGRLPQRRAAELVDLLAKEISRPDKRNQFQINLVRLLKAKGYFA